MLSELSSGDSYGILGELRHEGEYVGEQFAIHQATIFTNALQHGFQQFRWHTVPFQDAEIDVEDRSDYLGVLDNGI